MTYALRSVAGVAVSRESEPVGAEEALLDAFLHYSGLTRSPVLVTDGRTIQIANRAAAQTMQVVDQSTIVDLALSPTRGHGTPTTVMLSDGLEVCLTTHEVHGTDGTAVGVAAVVRRLHRRRLITDHQGSRVAHLRAQLPGVAPRWQQMVERIAAAGNDPLVLYGERGSGKLTIARAVLGPGEITVLDAEVVLTEGPAAWLSAVRRYVEEGEGDLVMAHIEHLEIALVRCGSRILEPARRRGRRTIGTATVAPGDPIPHGVGERADVLVEVPALRERPQDLPELIREMTRRRCAPGETPPRWMVDAVQALRRLDWPGNLRQLDGVVSDVLKRPHLPYIGRLELPARMLAQSSRRALTGMGQVEALALTKALHDAGGNKLAAANALGIARSTLYRRMRAHGIDG